MPRYYRRIRLWAPQDNGKGKKEKTTETQYQKKKTPSFLKNRIGNGTERLSWIGRVGMAVLSAEAGVPYPDPEHQPMKIA